MLIWSFSNWLIGLLLRYFFKAVGLKVASSGFAQATMQLVSIIILMPLSLAWAQTMMTQDYVAEMKQSWNMPLSLNRLFSLQTALSSIRRIGLPRLPPTPILRAAFVPYVMASFLQFSWHFLPASFISKLLGPYMKPGSVAITQDPTPHNINFTVAIFTLLVYCEWALFKLLSLVMHDIADIAIIRVQASLLPEDSQTVVPADRRIGAGVLVGRQVNRKDKWRMLLEAWQSTSWGMIWRYIKMSIKWKMLFVAIPTTTAFTVAFLDIFNNDYYIHWRTWPWHGPE